LQLIAMSVQPATSVLKAVTHCWSPMASQATVAVVVGKVAAADVVVVGKVASSLASSLARLPPTPAGLAALDAPAMRQ